MTGATVNPIPVSRLQGNDRHPASLSAEASDIGLRPGIWPVALEVVDAYGITVRLSRTRPMRDREGLVGVWYIGFDSLGLPMQAVIWND